MEASQTAYHVFLVDVPSWYLHFLVDMGSIPQTPMDLASRWFRMFVSKPLR